MGSLLSIATDENQEKYAGYDFPGSFMWNKIVNNMTTIIWNAFSTFCQNNRSKLGEKYCIR